MTIEGVPGLRARPELPRRAEQMPQQCVQMQFVI
jgi:hypothetical protein